MRPLLFTLLMTQFVVPVIAQNANEEFFEKKIRPLLATNCQGCHNAKLKSAGLDLSSAEGFAAGGGSGALVNAADPEKSLILQVTGYEGRLKMPPGKKLPDEALADLHTWVTAGGAWPGASAAAARPATPTGREITDQDRQYWAFRPVEKPAVPAVKAKAWVQSPIDAFILAKLEEKGLPPAPPADKLMLLRRVTYDLTGLPPTVDEIRDFLSDKSPTAFEKVVDRLLASPRYGEQWGRHWLDVARYADSTGNDEDHRYPYAWRYRDYVIDAFNRDLPYDQFVREQVAGDLLPAKDGGVNRQGIVATGFLALGAKALASPDKQKMLYDVYDEQVDVTSKAFMGLTLACARCHDHKFDPLLSKDYYSMAGMFASTKSFSDAKSGVAKMLFSPLAPKEEYEKYVRARDAVSRKTMEIEDLTDAQTSVYTKVLMPHLAEYMVAARSVYQDGQDVKIVAAGMGLREDILAKWVKYLKPSDKGRIYLDEWQNAAPDQYATVAKAYQERFEKQAADWESTLATWRTKFRKMVADGNMPPPEKPKFAEDKDNFFYEVYFEGPFGIPKKQRESVFAPEAKEQLAALRRELEALKKAMPAEPDMACAVAEGDRVQQKVFMRGDYNNPGVDAPPAFPLVLAKLDRQPKEVQGSGRLELAEWLASPEHPLTARVMVNRLFQWNFGEGIVRTPDNFGKMGERPTHPELLDYLASRFVEDGWSVKKMQKILLLSSAYQMSSNISDEAYKADPENRLFSRFEARRLSVEEFRDGLLAIDGTLDLTMGGTMQTGFGTDGENSEKRLSLKPEKEKRRMVYLPLRRANLPTMLNLFDFGDATTPQGKRVLTTVAPQALFVMNSEFVEERARNIVQSVSKDGSLKPGARVDQLYTRILNRPPTASERDAALSYLAGFTTKFSEPKADQDAWMSFARILIGSNEFMYLE